jgi:flagellar hook-associated protein 3 FlgL
MLIVAKDGTQLWIDLGETATIQTRTIADVINRINSNPNAAGKITARLAQFGNGIELVDTSGGFGPLLVRSVQGSAGAEHLGFVAAGQTETSTTGSVLQSEDRHTLEADSVFNTLLRLKAALEQNDTTEIGRSLARLDVDMDRVNFARAELGGRLQNLEIIGTRLEDENVELRAALSKNIDVDLVQAISDLTARQYAFEASLRTAASLMQMSLLNFL